MPCCSAFLGLHFQALIMTDPLLKYLDGLGTRLSRSIVDSFPKNLTSVILSTFRFCSLISFPFSFIQVHRDHLHRSPDWKQGLLQAKIQPVHNRRWELWEDR